jgi:pyruvate formate lyase activating enzyme
VKKAFLYEIKDGILRCLACPHYCHISYRKTGICGVRKNLKNSLYLLTYDKAAAVQVDPIEKKPLYHFLPGSRVFSIGSYGCNLRCSNCQNFLLSQAPKTGRELDSYGQELKPKAIIKFAKDNSCKSIAWTYNEPSISIEYSLETMKLAHAEGLKNIWVTNGYTSKETLKEILPYLDAVNVDIKSLEDDFYIKYCGGKLEPILNSCREYIKHNIWTEITTLIIPTLSDNLNMLKRIAYFIKNELGSEVPWHLSAFSPEISWKLKNLPDTSFSELERIYHLAKKDGLKNVYLGNVSDIDYSATYCPECGGKVVERDGYNIHFKKNRCANCGYKISGVYNND